LSLRSCLIYGAKATKVIMAGRVTSARNIHTSKDSSQTTTYKYDAKPIQGPKSV